MLGPSSSSTQTPSAVLAGLRGPAKDLSSAAGGAWCPARNRKRLASVRPLLGKSGGFWEYDLEDQYIDGLWAIHQEMRHGGVGLAEADICFCGFRRLRHPPGSTHCTSVSVFCIQNVGG